jgi:hypothetical protein
MSCDKLVYDLSQEVEGSPNVFIRKDWLNVLDNQNQNYQNNQSIIDTSQIANSNKYMGYMESYLAIPMTLSMTQSFSAAIPDAGMADSQLLYPSDFSFGLKNWFGQIIHSMTLDYNGTTIVQQTPFCNMWNTFKLLTSLSWADVATQGPTIGFYPDTSDSFGFFNPTAGNTNGSMVCNNDLGFSQTACASNSNSYNQWTAYTFNIGPNNAPVVGQPLGGNFGFTQRIKWITYDVASVNALPSIAGAQIGQWQNNASAPGGSGSQAPYYTYSISNNLNQIWKSNIFNKRALSSTPDGALLTTPVLQIAVMATVYLKHIHSFFKFCPLLKGVFMKLTLNLNNSNCSIPLPSVLANTTYGSFGQITNPSSISNSYVGGVQPLLISSMNTGMNWLTQMAVVPVGGNIPASTLYFDLIVGATVYNQNILNNGGTSAGNISKSVYLYIPAYTFNTPFEKAYLSNNIKQIKYTDIYQYQVVNQIQGNGQFNNLITNGIANIKSVLIIPFFSKLSTGITTGTIDTGDNYAEYLSPFDCAGCGQTAPMVSIGNFNVQISGQNAIYNMQRYSFEEWNNQLYGQNAVNGGLTDGLTSGLLNFNDFQTSYGYYYVNVERMLPVEQSVPKSVQILGTNYSQKSLNLWVFIEYGVEISIDVLTGARV